MRFTLTKADRIRTTQQYRALSQYGKRYYHPYFIIVWQLGQASRCRLGITVSKKVGKAVTRNRIKRIIREFFRLNKHALPDTLEINIIARKASGKAENAAIREQLGNWISTLIDTRQK